MKKIVLSVHTWIFLVIVVIAMLPRMIELIGKNFLFGNDQGLFYLAVKSLVVDHKLTLIGPVVGGQGGFFQGAGWYYLLAIPFLIFQGDPYGGQVLMVIIGMLTVIAAHIVFSKTVGKSAGLLIAFLIAVSPGVIPQSRFIWPPFPVALLSVGYIVSVYKVLQGSANYLSIATFMISLMAHFETATSIPLLLQFLCFYPFFLWIKRITVRGAILSCITFAIPFLPLLAFDFRHNFIMTNGILSQIMGTHNSQHTVTLMYAWAMAQNHLDVFLATITTTFFSQAVPAYLILAALMTMTIFYIRDVHNSTIKKQFVLFLLFSPFLMYIIFLLYLWPMWTWWILQIPITLCVLSGMLLSYMFSHQKFRVLGLIIVSVFLIQYVNNTRNWYRSDLHDFGGMAKIAGKKEVIDRIYQDAKGEQFGLLVFSPPIYTYPYDYLLWFYGSKKYGYVPTAEKKDTFYLLIEPDHEKPYSYKGWLETVIKEGKTIKTIELPSGFIVEKRHSER